MSPVRWRKVKELFHAAQGRDAGRRAVFLDDACRGDVVLRAEVQSLISAHEAEPEFIEQPALGAVAVPELVDLDRRVDTTVGRYRLARAIGFGGMGAVYLAARVDEAYQKQVAIKLLRTDRFLDGSQRRKELMRRFRTERQTMADLDHPNIARLLDGGTTDEGVPYFVMDYIEGQPIDQYCDAAGLSTGERLQLFRTACTAVHYAHQHLVVHCDLKPSNILVTPDGTPRLLDFGIAKLLERGSAAGPDPTRTTGRPMTPEYASPEQMRGERIMTASDVYSLGVVLYELLTGHRPYRLTDLPPQDIARVICEQPPDKPSAAIMRVEERATSDGSSWITLTPQSVSLTREGHPDRLRRRLAGDLDMIVLKALRKEPDRRYTSVEQFSEDIRRHLAGRPVIARPDTLAYRTTKFVRRHGWGVAATATVMVLLAGAAAVTTWAAREARQQRDLAIQQQRAAEANLARALDAEHNAAVEADTAQQVADYLVKVFETSDPFFRSTPGDRPGTEITAGELLAQGAAQIEAELNDQPEIQARLLHTLGNVYAGLGAYSEAERLLQKSLCIRRETFPAEHLDVTADLHSLGQLYTKTGEYTRAEPLLQDALSMRRRLLGAADPRIAASLDGLGTLYTHMGDYDRAQTYYQQALDMYGSVLGPDHVYVAMSLANQASVLHSMGQYAAAEPVYRKALATLRAARGDKHPDVATVMENLALLLQTRGEFEEAETTLRKVLDLRLELFGEEHEAVAQTLHNLGHVLSGRGDVEHAGPLYEQALALRRKLLGNDHTKVAETLNDLAYLRYAKGDFAGAEPLFRAALAIERKRYPDGHPSLALRLHNLASVFAAQGRYAEAEEMYREALTMRRERLGPHSPAAAETLHNLGGLLYLRGNLTEAEPLLREALEIRRQTFGDAHHTVAATCNSLGALLRERGEYDAAEQLLRQSLEIYGEVLPAGHPSTAGSMMELGVLLTLTGRPRDAEPLLRQAWEIRRRHYGNHWLTANAASALGACLTALREYEEAETLLTEGFTVLQSARGEDDRLTRRALRRIIDLYDAWGKRESAAEWRTKLELDSQPGGAGGSGRPGDGGAEPQA